jgi:hypothetical protein
MNILRPHPPYPGFFPWAEPTKRNPHILLHLFQRFVHLVYRKYHKIIAIDIDLLDRPELRWRHPSR